MNVFDEAAELTTILVVKDPDAAARFYIDCLEAELVSEHGSSKVLKLLGNWVLLVAAGGPTADKPQTEFAAPESIDKVGESFTIRVKDCQASYKELVNRGVNFLTPPVTHGRETRAFFTDLDNHLFEISEYRAE